jgi:hypothetical protein
MNQKPCLIRETKGKKFFFLELFSPYEWTLPPFENNPFACLVVNNNRSISLEDEYKICQLLVRFGCRNVHAVGYGASSWDDSVDNANLFEYSDYNIPDDKLVMSSWSDFGKETPEEHIGFIFHCADFDEMYFSNTLILFIDPDKELETVYIEHVKKFDFEPNSYKSDYRIV